MSDLAAQARALAGAGRLADGLALLERAGTGPDVPWPVVSAQAELLKKAGRLEDSIAAYRRLATLRPQSVPARHNLASTLGDLGRMREAEAACREAMALGGDAPETWLVLARALQGQNRFDEAEQAYRQALARRPGYAAPLTDLSQLIWMRSGDVEAACAPLDTAIAQAAGSQTQPLLQIKARLLEYAGRPQDAYATLTSGPLDAGGELAAAQAALRIDAAKALAHAQRAAALAGGPVVPVMAALAESHLALSQPEEALKQIEPLRQAQPFNQHFIAYQAVAWRMLGDPRYEALYDYDAFVRPAQLETPPGWASLADYLNDLAAALHGLHALETHPVGQSLRGGSQTTAALEQSDHPAIQAFFRAVDAPIRAYMAAVGSGADPLRSRNTGRYRLRGAWSVRLKPQGFHTDHVHQEGWLSSACHIELPPAVDEGREGWLRFGHTPDPPGLPAQHHVRPKPGTLVLFPSYMWHGTEPFGGDTPRLTLAFDILPAWPT